MTAEGCLPSVLSAIGSKNRSLTPVGGLGDGVVHHNSLFPVANTTAKIVKDKVNMLDRIRINH